MYQAKDIVRAVSLPHPAPGATDEVRVLFRDGPEHSGCAGNGAVRWVVYRSKGPYVDKACFYVYRTRKEALAALVRPATQGFNYRTNTPNPAVPLRPCSCGTTYRCPKHK
jgi:hypothetical protein